MLLVVTIFAFCLSNLASGDIAEISIRSSGGQVTPENLAQARIDLGLDQPLVIQYFNWLGKAVRFDFGNSFISGKPVINEIMSRFPNTLYLVLIASITTALDLTVQAVVLNEIKKLRDAGMSIMLITHDLGIVAQMADYVYVMNDGKIVESGNVFDIFDHPQHEYTKTLLGAAEEKQEVMV